MHTVVPLTTTEPFSFGILAVDVAKVAGSQKAVTAIKTKHFIKKLLKNKVGSTRTFAMIGEDFNHNDYAPLQFTHHTLRYSLFSSVV
jgi:hypothetical protein